MGFQLWKQQLLCLFFSLFLERDIPSKGLFTPSSFFFFLQIELLDFKGEDLFEDGGIIRRIKKKGEGYSNPNEGATVESE